MHLVGTVMEGRSCAPAILASLTGTLTISASSVSTTVTAQEIAPVLKTSVLDHLLRVLRVLSRCIEPLLTKSQIKFICSFKAVSSL